MVIRPDEPLSAARYLKEEVQELRDMIAAGGGTGGGINPAIINAKGDIVVGSADNIPSVLSVGANGQVLSADATAATGIKWIPAPTGGGGGGSGVSSVNGRTGDVSLAKADVGLTNADNTSDAAKPISTAHQLALNDKPDVFRWNGTAYVLAPGANHYVGPVDPGTVPEGSTWDQTG